MTGGEGREEEERKTKDRSIPDGSDNNNYKVTGGWPPGWQGWPGVTGQKEEKKEKEKEEKEAEKKEGEKKFLRTGRDGSIEGSTRGPRRPK